MEPGQLDTQLVEQYRNTLVDVLRVVFGVEAADDEGQSLEEKA